MIASEGLLTNFHPNFYMASTWAELLMHLTKVTVDKLELPIERDQIFYRDDRLKGFAVRITKNGVKSFVVEKMISGKVKRITLGRYGELTVELARKEAQKLLGKIATGIDPLAEQQSERLQKISQAEVFADYKIARKALKPKTLYDYHRIMEVAFVDWKDKPLLAITKDKIAKKHQSLGEQRGESYANLAMRMLRALINFASGQYENVQGL